MCPTLEKEPVRGLVGLPREMNNAFQLVTTYGKINNLRLRYEFQTQELNQQLSGEPKLIVTMPGHHRLVN